MSKGEEDRVEKELVALVTKRPDMSGINDRTLAQWSDRTLRSYYSASGQSDVARYGIAESDRTCPV